MEYSDILKYRIDNLDKGVAINKCFKYRCGNCRWFDDDWICTHLGNEIEIIPDFIACSDWEAKDA
jgi:hypothetical protein